MRCDQCRYWSSPRKKFIAPGNLQWGTCDHLTYGDPERIIVITADPDGEYVESRVETMPDFFCAEFEEVQDEKAV